MTDFQLAVCVLLVTFVCSARGQCNSAFDDCGGDEFNTAVIVGIVIAVVVAALSIISVVIVIVKRRRIRRFQQNYRNASSFPTYPMDIQPTLPEPLHHTHNHTSHHIHHQMHHDMAMQNQITMQNNQMTSNVCLQMAHTPELKDYRSVPLRTPDKRLDSPYYLQQLCKGVDPVSGLSTMTHLNGGTVAGIVVGCVGPAGEGTPKTSANAQSRDLGSLSTKSSPTSKAGRPQQQISRKPVPRNNPEVQSRILQDSANATLLSSAAFDQPPPSECNPHHHHHHHNEPSSGGHSAHYGDHTGYTSHNGGHNGGHTHHFDAGAHSTNFDAGGGGGGLSSL
ncbi:hypothetical protein BDP27DRAFT_1359912 [Rhodocollybia butyracea]|uniref:Uncharacterized protein n=1 Tax=Rhodocollybia butyracea TaxID=206335 RepID=A0A9P5Q3P7_9AGAR|nr:hypothetical protein BDP27DRAFT_1359912 [Rhodocollybia butyracea]